MSENKQNPFNIERSNNSVIIESHQPFNAMLCVPLPTYRKGTAYALPALMLSKDSKLILSTMGYDDIVIINNNEGAKNA
jgi:hypothetical protein